MRNIRPKLCQAELHSVDEGANCVLLIPSERLSDQWLQVGCKLIRQASHAVLDESADSFHDTILIDELGHDTVNKGP